jgi:dCMP deaminase
MGDIKWDRRFLQLAEEISSWSKDPSSQVGAVAVKDRHILATGYNGLPMGTLDLRERLDNRELKYALIQHAEANLLAHAARHGLSLRDATVYVYPFFPCTNCCGALINAGIGRIVVPDLPIPERWATNFGLSQKLLEEAGIPLDVLPLPSAPVSAAR